VDFFRTTAGRVDGETANTPLAARQDDAGYQELAFSEAVATSTIPTTAVPGALRVRSNHTPYRDHDDRRANEDFLRYQQGARRVRCDTSPNADVDPAPTAALAASD